MRVIDKIRAILNDPDRTQAWLAERLGVSQPTVHRWLSGSEPKGDRRDAINVLYDQLFPSGDYGRGQVAIPVVGYLGAGAEVEPDYEQVPPEGLEQVTVPFEVPYDMLAFKVRGVSMLPVFKPDSLIIVYKDQRRPIEAFYGEEAAVRTEEGRRFIKTITRGTQSGTVNLMSWNDPTPIENQRLLWIGEIFAVLPPSALRKVERQGGIQGQLRLRA